MKKIRIAAALIVDRRGQLLLVRKSGTSRFMQPGGKIEFGETPIAAVVRELAEEIGLAVLPGELEFLGRYAAVAANEADHEADADVFYLEISPEVTVGAEIEEFCWVHPDDASSILLAPLTEIVLLPLLAERR